jgi:hypothetical protein
MWVDLIYKDFYHSRMSLKLICESKIAKND